MSINILQAIDAITTALDLLDGGLLTDTDRTKIDDLIVELQTANTTGGQIKALLDQWLPYLEYLRYLAFLPAIANNMRPGQPTLAPNLADFGGNTAYLDHKCKAANAIWYAMKKNLEKAELEDWDALYSLGVDMCGAMLSGLIEAIPSIGDFIGELAVELAESFLTSELTFDLADVILVWDNNKEDLVMAMYQAENRSQAIMDVLSICKAEGMNDREVLFINIYGYIKDLFDTLFSNIDVPTVANPIICSEAGDLLIQSSTASPFNVMIAGTCDAEHSDENGFRLDVVGSSTFIEWGSTRTTTCGVFEVSFEFEAIQLNTFDCIVSMARPGVTEEYIEFPITGQSGTWAHTLEIGGGFDAVVWLIITRPGDGHKYYIRKVSVTEVIT